MANYTLATTNVRQDAALQFAASRAGAATVDDFVRQQFARIVQKALDEHDKDVADRLPSAFLSATPAKQAQIKALLNLDAQGVKP